MEGGDGGDGGDPGDEEAPSEEDEFVLEIADVAPNEEDGGWAQVADPWTGAPPDIHVHRHGGGQARRRLLRTFCD